MPSRFVYHSRIRSSGKPQMFRLMSGLLFGKINVMPDRERVDRFEAYLMLGDAPADRAVGDLFGKTAGHAAGFRNMKRALEGEAPDPSVLEKLPESFVSLINEARKDPPWLHRDRLENGAAACRRLGLNAMSVLGDLALLGGYANPDISKPLVFTGQLQGERTFDRLAETSQFWYDVTRKGAMKIGGKGFNSALRVRMMHAIVRQRLLDHPGWDSDMWGWPINKADSMSTNVAFSMAMIYGVKMLGFHLSDREMSDILHFWRYVGFLMGDDPDWLPSTVEEGLQCLILIHFSNANKPDDGSITLAHDYLRTFEPDPNEKQWDKQLIRHFVYWRHRAYAEYLIPPGLHRKLRIPSSRMTWLLVPFVQGPAIFAIDRLRRLVPGGNEWMEEQGSRQQDRIMEILMGGREAEYDPGTEMAR